MVHLLFLPFKIAFFILKLAVGLVFSLLGAFLFPLLILAGLVFLARRVFC